MADRAGALRASDDARRWTDMTPGVDAGKRALAPERGQAPDHDVPARVDAQASTQGPRLVVLRDVDARAGLVAPRFGAKLLDRVSAAAWVAGFTEVVLAPGVRAPGVRAPGLETQPKVREVAFGEPLTGAALVLYEGTWVDPALLALMVRHPLDEDDAHSLYDEHDRPAAYFTGDLREVPATMPLAEELAWPQGMGPHSVVRVVEVADVERATWAMLRSVGEPHDGGSRFERRVVLPTLHVLERSGRTVAQLELIALGACALAAVAVLTLGWGGLVLGTSLALLGVHVSRVLRSLRLLRGERGSPGGWAWLPGETLARATRPLAHAALTAALTYELTAQSSRSALANLVLLMVGAASTLVALAHARAILREQGQLTLRLPRGDRFFARIEIALPSWLEGAPLVETLAVCLAVTGQSALPWSVFVGAAMARSWRWFVGPERSYSPAKDTAEDGAGGGEFER